MLIQNSYFKKILIIILLINIKILPAAVKDIFDIIENVKITSKEQLKKIQEILKLGVELSNAEDEDGTHILHQAIYSELEEPTKILGALIAAGADVDYRDDDGDTPLALACLCKSSKIIPISKVLINAKANVNTKNSKKLTPLHLAAQNEKAAPELIQLLLDSKANIDSLSSLRDRPIDFACREYAPKKLRVLLDNWADCQDILPPDKCRIVKYQEIHQMLEEEPARRDAIVLDIKISLATRKYLLKQDILPAVLIYIIENYITTGTDLYFGQKELNKSERKLCKQPKRIKQV